MNLRRCVQALLLLWLSLTAACGGECVAPRLARAPPAALLDRLPRAPFRPPRTRALSASRDPGASRAGAATRRLRRAADSLTGRPGPGTGPAGATAVSERGLGSVSGITRLAPCPSWRLLEVEELGAAGVRPGPRAMHPTWWRVCAWGEHVRLPTDQWREPDLSLGSGLPS